MKWWRPQDWFWLICLLLFAQGFTFLHNDLVMSVVAYVSTFVSIALAAVAIYISVREATKGDHVKDQINLALGELREKLTQMDSKINKLDPQLINEIEESGEKVAEEIVSQIKDKDDISTDEIIKIVRDEIKRANNDLKSTLTFDISDDYARYYKKMDEIKNYYSIIDSLIESLDSGIEFTVDELADRIYDKLDISIPRPTVLLRLMHLKTKGVLLKSLDKSYTYRKK